MNKGKHDFAYTLSIHNRSTYTIDFLTELGLCNNVIIYKMDYDL